MDKIEDSLRKRIRAFIKEHKLTQKRFADSIDCTHSLLSMFLNGRRSLMLPEIERACNVMGFTLGFVNNPEGTPLEVEIINRKLQRLLSTFPSGFRLVNQMVDTLLESSEQPGKRREKPGGSR